MKKYYKILLLIPMLLSSACAVDPGYTRYLQGQEVDARVSERWDAVIKKDYRAAYQYLAEGYKEITSEDEYAKSMNSKIIWKSYELLKTHCDNDVCKVDLKANYLMPPMFGMPQGISSSEYVKETWIYQSGEWLYLPPMPK